MFDKQVIEVESENKSVVTASSVTNLIALGVPKEHAQLADAGSLIPFISFNWKQAPLNYFVLAKGSQKIPLENWFITVVTSKLGLRSTPLMEGKKAPSGSEYFFQGIGGMAGATDNQYQYLKREGRPGHVVEDVVSFMTIVYFTDPVAKKPELTLAEVTIAKSLQGYLSIIKDYTLNDKKGILIRTGDHSNNMDETPRGQYLSGKKFHKGNQWQEQAIDENFYNACRNLLQEETGVKIVNSWLSR